MSFCNNQNILSTFVKFESKSKTAWLFSENLYVESIVWSWTYFGKLYDLIIMYGRLQWVNNSLYTDYSVYTLKELFEKLSYLFADFNYID